MYCGENGPSAVKCHPQYAMSAQLFACSISWTPDQIYVAFQPSDIRQTFQVKICAQLPATSGQLQRTYSATPEQLQRNARTITANNQSNSSATPGPLQGYFRATSAQLQRTYSATPEQLQRNARATRGQLQGNSSAMPGPLQGNFRATQAQLWGNYSEMPGQLERTTRATPAQLQGHSRTIPAELIKYSSEIRVSRINLQRKPYALFYPTQLWVSQFQRYIAQNWAKTPELTSRANIS